MAASFRSEFSIMLSEAVKVRAGCPELRVPLFHLPHISHPMSALLLYTPTRAKISAINLYSCSDLEN